MSSSRILDSLAELGEREGRPIWLSIGMFDGVHVGHQSVLNLARGESSDVKDSISAVLTFPEHPSGYLRPADQPMLIMDSERKAAHLLELGQDWIVMQPFDDSLAKVSAEDFPARLRELIPSLVGICVGENFRFGQARRGDSRSLNDRATSLGLQVKIAAASVYDGSPVSSSRIRDSLSEGRIEAVNSMLGRSYRISGRVVEGRKLGGEIGFPTLNLPWSPQARPAYGVYLVQVALLEKRELFYGVSNYGLRPTVIKSPSEPLLEVHLLGEGDLSSISPGVSVSVDLLKFIRPERKFESVDSLKTQIAADKIEAEKLLAKL